MTWKNKVWYLSTTEYYLAGMKDEIMQFAATWRELEGSLLGEVSPKEGDRPDDLSHLCHERLRIMEQLRAKSNRL